MCTFNSRDSSPHATNGLRSSCSLCVGRAKPAVRNQRTHRIVLTPFPSIPIQFEASSFLQPRQCSLLMELLPKTVGLAACFQHGTDDHRKLP